MQKPEPKLTHMPFLIKQKITDSLPNVGTKLALSRMSKEFQSFAKESPNNYDGLSVEMQADKVSVVKRFSSTRTEKYEIVIEFFACENGAVMRNWTGDWQKVLPEMDYRKAAVQYCLRIMNAKTRIGEFTLRTDGSILPYTNPKDPEDRNYPAVYPKRKFVADRAVVLTEIERCFQGLKHQLLVKRIKIMIRVTQFEILKIFSYLEPGTLEGISLDYAFPSDEMRRLRTPLCLDQVSETEQWKRARKLKVFSYECDVSYEKLAHFIDLDIHLREPQLNMKSMIQSFLNQPTFLHLDVKCDRGFDQTGFQEYLDQFQQEQVDGSDRMLKKIKIRMPGEPEIWNTIFYNSKWIIAFRNAWFKTDPWI